MAKQCEVPLGRSMSLVQSRLELGPKAAFMQASSPLFVCTRCSSILRRRAAFGAFRSTRRLYSTTALPSSNKFATFFSYPASSPRSPQSTAVQPAQDDRPQGIEVHRGADMSRFPVLLPLPTEEELRTFKPAQPLTAPRTLKVYVELSKGRLTVLNVLVAMAGVALCPLPATVPVLLATAAGTALCSAAANATNQVSEVPYDAQMARTRMRPLVRRAIKPSHAAAFATVTGIIGPAILWNFATPLAGAIGAGTMLAYAFIYTPMKRRTVANTWVGAVIGAPPFLLGWTAVGGALWPSALHPLLLYLPTQGLGIVEALQPYVPYLYDAAQWPFASGNPMAALTLFAFMYSWQFPHFCPLSHVTREGYALAGYRMLAVTNPAKNAAVSLRHSIALLAMSSTLVPLSGLTTWAFAATSLPVNALLLHGAVKFWRTRGDKEARRLFHLSLVYIPIMLGLMMYHKEGMEWVEWLKSLPGGDADSDNVVKQK